jgi:hypothetical protein
VTPLRRRSARATEEEPQPPQLPDTAERSALPLPLPDREAEDEAKWEPPPETAAAAASLPETGKPEEPAPIEPPEEEPEPDEEPEPEPVAEPVSESEEEAVPEPGPEPPETSPESPPYQPAPAVAGIGDGGQASPAHPELLVAGAFAGGLALAFLIKRLGS